MIRPGLPYRCADCHKVFLSMETEWMATASTSHVNTTCPRCGSKHTLPLLASKRDYEDIWKMMDENN